MWKGRMGVQHCTTNTYDNLLYHAQSQRGKKSLFADRGCLSPLFQSPPLRAISRYEFDPL